LKYLLQALQGIETNKTSPSFDHIDEIFRAVYEVCQRSLTQVLVSPQVLDPNAEIGLVDLNFCAILFHP
jgi:hypothetical protein